MSALSPAALGAHPFLRGMPAELLDRLAPHARYVTIPAGQRLFEEGGTADRLWLLQAGQVAVDLDVPGQGPLVVETLGRGDVLGWSWLFTPARWSFGALARQPVQAIELAASGVLAVCAERPEFGYELTRRLVKVVADRVGHARLRLIELYKIGPGDPE